MFHRVTGVSSQACRQGAEGEQLLRLIVLCGMDPMAHLLHLVGRTPLVEMCWLRGALLETGDTPEIQVRRERDGSVLLGATDGSEAMGPVCAPTVPVMPQVMSPRVAAMEVVDAPQVMSPRASPHEVPVDQPQAPEGHGGATGYGPKPAVVYAY